MLVNSDEVTKRYESWGRYPKAEHCAVNRYNGALNSPIFQNLIALCLPFGYGRSYGDTCLNNGGILIDTTPLRQLIAFDKEKGILRCEAGVTFAEILDIIVPHGWFIPVSPGTKFVSVAGAIANDVHGKNHHK